MALDKCKLVFRGVPLDISESDFVNFIKHQSGVTPRSVNLAKFTVNPTNQMGFVEFDNERDAGMALCSCMQAEYLGHTITVSYLKDKPKQEESTAHDHRSDSQPPHNQGGRQRFQPNSRPVTNNPPFAPVTESQPNAQRQVQRLNNEENFKLCVYQVAKDADKGDFEKFIADKTGCQPTDIFFAHFKKTVSDVKNAFVTFKNPEEAAKAKAIINEGICYCGRTLQAAYAYAKEGRPTKPAQNFDDTASVRSFASSSFSNDHRNNPSEVNGYSHLNRPDFNANRHFGTQNSSGSGGDMNRPRSYQGGNNNSHARTRPVTSLLQQSTAYTEDKSSSVTGSSVTLVASPSGMNLNMPPFNEKQSDNRGGQKKLFSPNKLCIMPLPASISNEKVEALFPNASHIVSVSLTKPRKNQFATGEVCCAFVEFDSEEHCTEALESTSENIEVEGMKCRVQRAMEKPSFGTCSANQKQPAPEKEQPNAPQGNHRPQSNPMSPSTSSDAPPKVANDSQRSAANSPGKTPLKSNQSSTSRNSCDLSTTSASSGSRDEAKVLTLKNVKFASLSRVQPVAIQVIEYNSHLDFIFDVVDTQTDPNLQSILNARGERAPRVNYVLPGEVLLTTLPGKRDYSRVVVRNPDLPAGVSVEDLDTCAQFSVALQNLKLINEECLASPVKRFHGALIKCEPLEDQLNEFNEILEQYLIGDEDNLGNQYMMVFNQLFNWVDIEIINDVNNVKDTLTEVMIETGLGFTPKTNEDITREMCMDPLKIDKGDKTYECILSNVISPSEMYVHDTSQSDLDFLETWSHGELITVPNYLPFPFEAVCTLLDGQWCRAKVLSVDEGHANLFTVDWGEYARQPFNKIRPAPRNWIYNPVTNNVILGQAVHLCLEGVDRSVKYSTEHLNMFRSTILPRDNTITVRVVDLNKRCRSHLCQVFLTDQAAFKTPNVLQICHQKNIIPSDPLPMQQPAVAAAQLGSSAVAPEPEQERSVSMTPSSSCNERRVNGVAGPPTSTPKQESLAIPAEFNADDFDVQQEILQLREEVKQLREEVADLKIENADLVRLVTGTN